jgi:hypothetical protein
MRGEIVAWRVDAMSEAWTMLTQGLAADTDLSGLAGVGVAFTRWAERRQGKFV